MELKEKYKALVALFELGENETFAQCINRVVFSGKSHIYFDKYVELFPDLSVDELRSCWQFWYADRMEKKQDYTTDSLACLVGKLALKEGEKTILDCCAGSGSLTIGKWNWNHDLKFVCLELDSEVIPLLLFNIIVRNIDAEVYNADVLTGEIYACWKICKSGKYSAVRQEMFPEFNDKYDCGICNPPFNLTANGTLLNFSFVENVMRKCDCGCFILPCGTLSNAREQNARKALIESGKLKAVINVGSGFFESTGVSVALYLISHAPANGVMLVNAEPLVEARIRKQRGEGSASHTMRIYEKKMMFLSDAAIDAIVQMCTRETEYSSFVSKEKLAERQYNLNFGVYQPVTLDKAHTMHRDYKDIINDLNRVNRLKSSIKVNVNKVWAKQLGLDEVIKLAEQDKAIADETASNLKSLGITEELNYSEYISSSNSKILEIKQQDKDFLSPVLESFLPLWKQHIRTMNNLENMLLTELRDALRPALIDGTIEICPTARQ